MARLFCVWTTPPITTVPPSATRTPPLRCCLLFVQRGIQLRANHAAEIGDRIFHVKRSGKIVFLRGNLRVTLKRRKASTYALLAGRPTVGW